MLAVAKQQRVSLQTTLLHCKSETTPQLPGQATLPPGLVPSDTASLTSPDTPSHSSKVNALFLGYREEPCKPSSFSSPGFSQVPGNKMFGKCKTKPFAN